MIQERTIPVAQARPDTFLDILAYIEKLRDAAENNYATITGVERSGDLVVVSTDFGVTLTLPSDTEVTVAG